MHKIELDNFIIEYTNSDVEYIDDLINYFNDIYKDIMNFFNIKKFNKKINIKLWDSKDKYREYISNIIKNYSTNNKVPEWEIARSTSLKEESRIDLMSYKEVLKCKGHNKDELNSLFKVLVHEFVHICTFEYNNHTESLTWFTEALATNLSNQYNNSPLVLDVSLDDIIKGKVSYTNYYIMGKYLLDNYDKDYILELTKNKELLIKDTPKIYKETIKYCNNTKLEKYNNIKTPEELYKFMENYIKYGLKIDDKLYEWGKEEFQKACEEKWRLRNGLDIIKSGYGHCWDQTELERDWFKNHNYEYKTLFIIFLLDYDNNYVCHTYLIYKDKNKWCWFEHADYNNKGIHKFNTIEEAILAQKEKHIEFNKSLNLPMNKEIIDTIHIYEYQSPKIGSTNQEFLDNIFNNAKDITKNINKKVLVNSIEY